MSCKKGEHKHHHKHHHHHHHHHKSKGCKVAQGCNRNSGFNACTTIPALLILQQSGLLCNDRAYILILLVLMCGGFSSGACGCDC